MKRFALILAVGGLALATLAQVPSATSTNIEVIPAPAPAESRSVPNTNSIANLLREMTADMADIDPKSRLATFTGNVRVNEPRMRLACDLLTARLPDGGGGPDHIIAERNVVINAMDDDGKPVHATANRAEYTLAISESATNELITFTGDPVKYNVKGIPGSGTTVIWNKTTGSVKVMGFHSLEVQPDALRTNLSRPSTTVTN